MSRARPLIVLLIAVTAGSVFACGTYRYVQKQPDRSAALPTKPVAVAAADRVQEIEVRDGRQRLRRAGAVVGDGGGEAISGVGGCVAASKRVLYGAWRLCDAAADQSHGGRKRGNRRGA